MFIPLHDHNSWKHVVSPVVTWGLIILNAVIFFTVQGAGLGEMASALAYSYGLIPSVFFDQKDLPTELQVFPDSWSIVTYAFMHGDFMHLLGNMLFLWVFGDNVEDAMGHVRFLIFYLLSAAAGGFAYMIAAFGSDVPLVGASGAVSGVVAAYLMLHPKVKIWVLALGRIPLRLSAQWVLGAWVVYQVFNAVFTQESQVAWSAHIGGLAAGAILVIFLRRPGVPLFDRGL
ncbi:membrane associated rhomboid family serine protease [Roseibium hamelinense]|uniref:Membrane associated rhomboid family serine protease n=1 Tax=Roseibium hamelinense TaxID=150831 RepID=A0A562SPZ1_9HYPH|nr:rhomboid family intramembrane serine protease [Roseibium hamelinense]MTI44023.1 rhomboid family intramembrane serine protease [Roseibium hamelinense]TWI82770.1 membrane associated rhomboid family serine protease [Roseibium hamelinense]